jgi:hypothetical protein
MADRDKSPDTAIIGRDADAAAERADDSPRRIDGDEIAEQLSQTTSEDAGGNVSGTAADDTGEGLDIVFLRESDEDTRH